MVGIHLLTRMAAKTRLILLFSTVLVLFFARISLADEPSPSRAHVGSVAFEDFMEFQSLAGAEIQREKGECRRPTAGIVNSRRIWGRTATACPRRPERMKSLCFSAFRLMSAEQPVAAALRAIGFKG